MVYPFELLILFPFPFFSASLSIFMRAVSQFDARITRRVIHNKSLGGFHHHRFLTGFWLVLVFLPFFGGKETPAKLHVMKSNKVSVVSQGFLTGFLALLPLPWSDLRHAWIRRLVRFVTLHYTIAPRSAPLSRHLFRCSVWFSICICLHQALNRYSQWCQQHLIWALSHSLIHICSLYFHLRGAMPTNKIRSNIRR